MKELKERAFIARAEEIRGILDGSIAQFRRPVKPQPPSKKWDIATVLSSTNRGREGMHFYARYNKTRTHLVDQTQEYFRSPFGYVGARLWVRETWSAQYVQCTCYIQPCDCCEARVVYEADNSSVVYNDYDMGEWLMPVPVRLGGRGSAACMPRFACRLLLEITAIAAERNHKTGVYEWIVDFKTL